MATPAPEVADEPVGDVAGKVAGKLFISFW
jgi:hypothetical protein